MLGKKKESSRLGHNSYSKALFDRTYISEGKEHRHIDTMKSMELNVPFSSSIQSIWKDIPLDIKDTTSGTRLTHFDWNPIYL